MKKKEFEELLNGLQNLSPYQKKVLKKSFRVPSKVEEVSSKFETNPDEIICPHCASLLFVKWGERNALQRYKCLECKKTFNSLTGTSLAKLKNKEHWLDYSECLAKGYTIRKAAKICSISIETSFRWRHRLTKSSKLIHINKILGIENSEESYFLENRKERKRPKAKIISNS